MAEQGKTDDMQDDKNASRDSGAPIEEIASESLDMSGFDVQGGEVADDEQAGGIDTDAASETDSADPDADIADAADDIDADDDDFAPFHGGAHSAKALDENEDGIDTAAEFRDFDEDDMFSSPRSFDFGSDDDAPKLAGNSDDEDDDDQEEDLLFDEDNDPFAPDDQNDEFLDGTADSFVDDPQEDYYLYGDKMHGVRDDALVADDEEESEEPILAAPAAPVPAGTNDARRTGAHGKHGSHSKAAKKQAADAEMPEHQRKSRRMRRTLTIVIVLLVVLIAGLGIFGYQLITTSRDVATQQNSGGTSDVTATNSSSSTKDASTQNTKKTNVAGLVGIMGKSQADAVKTLGHGATVSVSSDVNEEGNAVKKRVTVVLTDEPADSKAGTPTVYLGLNEAGTVIMAGYSSSTASLGYGSLSFADAISNEHVVEKTLNEAGLSVADGTAVLPAKSAYSTYASDGTTLVKESCSFQGNSSINGANYTWSAVLVYDYTAANASGNLADTVRQIYIYINAA